MDRNVTRSRVLFAASTLLFVVTCNLRAEEPRPGNKPPATAPDVSITEAQRSATHAGLKWLAGRVHDLFTRKAENRFPSIEVNTVAAAGMVFLQEGSLPGRGTYGKELQ